MASQSKTNTTNKKGFYMLVKNQPKYIDHSKISEPTKSGIRVISEMSTSRILWFVACKHSKGLKTLTILALASYIAYDKVARLFL